MMRKLIFSALLALTAPAYGQAISDTTDQDDCRIIVQASPTAWTVDGFDPFSDLIAEKTFSVTYRNDSANTCVFTPVFEVDEPPFGLSKGGSGRNFVYNLINLTDSLDVTPRAGRSNRNLFQGELQLDPNDTQVVLYRLVVDTNGVDDSGIYSENLRIVAQDRNFNMLGGTSIVAGIEILPSARIGLAGAYTFRDGQAFVDLGELRPGIVRAPLQLNVLSTGRYELNILSENAGRLRLDNTDWFVPYSMRIGGNEVNLTSASMIAKPKGRGLNRESLPIQFDIGDTSNRRAGQYSDVISISVTAR